MEELQAKHRKEAKELQGRITQKKKSASKKTRKGVNDECENLERELKERQSAELAALTPSSEARGAIVEGTATNDLADETQLSLSLNDTSPTSSSLEIAGSEAPDSAITDPDPEQSAFRKKPSRAKARLARRAAEQEALVSQASKEADSLPDLKARERERMLSEFNIRGLKEKEIRADGHCLYSAFADQMEVLGLPLGTAPGSDIKISGTVTNGSKEMNTAEATTPGYRRARSAAAEYIESHPDDFVPFLEESLPEYVHKVRDTGEWGGQLELLALAKSYGVRISVLQADGRVEDILPEGQDGAQRIWLAYYRHGFGLGEHYNSLRKAV